MSGPLTVLFLGANPSGTDPLGLGREVQAIQDALNETALRDRFCLETVWASSFQDLLAGLLKHQPAVVHFSGHGRPDALLFEAPAGAKAPAPVEALAQLFGAQAPGARVKLVVFNACDSLPAAEAVAAHGPCAVGTTEPIGDGAAVAFAAGLYRGLGFGLSVAASVELGRTAVAGARFAGAEDVRVTPADRAAQVVLAQRVSPQVHHLDGMLAANPNNRELQALRAAVRRAEEAAATPRLVAGRLFANRYELKGEIGRGSFGVVWRATDSEPPRREVALKILHPHLGEAQRRRFEAGLRAMGRMNHPHIVAVWSGPHRHDEGHYAALELLHEDLDQAQRGGRLKPGEVPGLIAAVASALAHAHAVPLHHRDVKPKNILLTADGRPKLTDFDLVHIEDSVERTGTAMVGTVFYMPPEFLRPRPLVSAAADQFSLALTAACLFLGKGLEDKDNEFGVLEREDLIEALPVGEAVKAVLRRGMHRRPEQRWPDVVAFAEALTEAVAGAGAAVSAGQAPAAAGTPATPGALVAAATAYRPALRHAPAGTFTMGSPPDEPGRSADERQHEVAITQALWVMETPISRAQWTALLGSDPSYFKRDGALPVERVSWFEAVAFANALSEKEGLAPAYEVEGPTGTLGGGLEPGEGYGDGDFRYARVKRIAGASGYRLPTEAEWEYLARAGTAGAIFSGEFKLLGENNAPALDGIAWYGGNSGVEHGEGYDSSGWKEMQRPSPRSATQVVGQKAANGWGLRDMLGNVFEWCEDWYGAYPTGSKLISDPPGPPTGVHRVIRGGSWDTVARGVRAALRVRWDPVGRDRDVGFRLVRAPSS